MKGLHILGKAKVIRLSDWMNLFIVILFLNNAYDISCNNFRIRPTIRMIGYLLISFGFINLNIKFDLIFKYSVQRQIILLIQIIAFNQTFHSYYVFILLHLTFGFKVFESGHLDASFEDRVVNVGLVQLSIRVSYKDVTVLI